MKLIYEERRIEHKDKGIEIYVWSPSPNEQNEEDHDMPCIIRFRERVAFDLGADWPTYAPDKWIFSHHEKNQAIREAIQMIDEEAGERWGE